MTLDELVLKLILDPSGLKQGAKEATDATEKLSTDLVASAEKGEKAQTGALAAIVQGWNAMVLANRKAAEASTQSSKVMVSSTEKLAQSGEKAIRTFGALFLLFAGARSVKDFASSMISLDAAIGRVAHNTGSTTEVISGIGRAAERVGGTFDGAVAGVRGFVDAYQQLRLTGQSSILDPIARLQGLTGRSISLTQDWRKSLGDVADALQALDQKNPAQADYLGRQIIGDEGLTTVLKRGRAALNDTVADNPITAQQAADAQKLQAQLVAVRQGFQDIGNSILMDFGPAAIQALRWVRDLIEANRSLIETKVKEWVADVGKWFVDHKGDIEAFGTAVGSLVTAAGQIASAFTSQSPMMQALELFAATMGGTVLKAVTTVSGALGTLFALPAPAWFAGLMLGAGGAAGAMNVGHTDEYGRDAGTWGGDAPAKDGDSQPTPRPTTTFATMWAWLKSKVGLGDDPKVRDDIGDTAKSTGGILDLMRSTASNALSAFTGVTSSSGGLGGSGQHFGGGNSPGASLTDRGHGRRGTGVGSASGIQSDAGAPGANGFGAIDAPYRASVDAKGEGGQLSPRELFDYLKAHGATDNEATMLTGAAGNESSFNSRAVHDNGNGYGLWGHNIHDRIDMRGMTWQQQADAALAEAKRDYAGRINAARTPQDLADAEMHYERPRGFHSNNPRGGDNYTGRLHTIDRFAKSFGTLGNTVGAPAAGPGGTTAGSVGATIAGMRDAGLLTDEQCVTLAMAAVGVRKGSGQPGANVHDWRKGAGADEGNLQPGTPVATFLNRDGSQSDRYAGGGAGTPGAHLDHAGVFQKYVLDAYGKRIGMTILEQYQGSRGAHLKDYLFGKGFGEANGSNYHAVLGPDGRPLGNGSSATLGDALHRGLRAVAHANALLSHHNDNHPVEVTDKGVLKLQERTFGNYLERSKKHLDIMPSPDTIRRAAMYRGMGRAAAHLATGGGHTFNHSSDTRVGAINIHTAATDARGIAADIEPHLKRGQAAVKGDYGWA